MNNRLTMLVVALMLSACSSVGQPPIRYYVINPVTQQPLTTSTAESTLNIRVLDLRIPQYLEHFQIAKRTGEQELTFSDDHQWGENLRKNLIRTLARNLSRQLNSPTVFTPLIRSSAKPDYSVTVYIDQFEQADDGRVQLSARYQIINSSKKDSLLTRVFEKHYTNTSATSYPSMVSTMQTLYNELSLDISKTLIMVDSRPS